MSSSLSLTREYKKGVTWAPFFEASGEAYPFTGTQSTGRSNFFTTSSQC